MAKRIPEQALIEIEDFVRRHPDGVTLKEITDALKTRVPPRTLQYRLRYLVNEKRLVPEGDRRWRKYRVRQDQRIEVPSGALTLEPQPAIPFPLSKAAIDIQKYLLQPVTVRKPVGYNRDFLESYRPNVTAYLSPAERARLRDAGSSSTAPQPAGTYAKQILSRLLIDLSWNSSRLEGNTYSLLDTRRLIEFGQQPEGRQQLEAQMILNHKDAIAFLVGAAEDIGFNRYTILNLHAILANNLIADPSAAGRLRRIAVGIELSTYHPLEVPQIIEECFDHILATATALEDPFEQAFFVMVQLPYLQPFDDVNKRVSRLAANIPFIKRNLSPLSFTDLPRDLYTQAVLGVYELNKIDLLKDVFIWAYERSADRYVAVRQSLGEPDPFRLRHRAALQRIVAEIIRARMDRKSAADYISKWVKENIPADERERFREMAESELLGLHEGNYARYEIRPAEFAAWRQEWGEKTA